MKHNNNHQGLLVEALNSKVSLLSQIIKDQHYLEIEVSGTSMEPTLHDGETVLIEPTEGQLNIDDIILFYDSKYQLALHRIIGFDDKVIVLCGDNATTKDKITIDQVLGKMTKKTNSLTDRTNWISKDYFCKTKGLIIRIVILHGKLSTIKLEEG